MPSLSRADTSIIGRWWWTVDRWTLLAVATLIGFGYIMVLAASPAVAVRIHEPRTWFILKQVLFLGIAGSVVVATSMLSPRNIRRLAVLLGLAALALTAATLVVGVEIKGARRWIALPGISVQPSEFLKPCFAVVTAWLLSEGRRYGRFAGTAAVLATYAVIALLLKSQPDMGMLVVVTSVLLIQGFIAGLNLVLVGMGVGAIAAAGVGAFFVFPHVHSRVMRFLDPTSGDNYQVITALQAFGQGGLLGRGPGEGHIKDILPDAHADFVFAVMGEEFGLVVCLLVLGVFAFVVLRGLLKLIAERDLFVVLGASGLLASFGLQAFVNMASSLRLIPTKGMTLPFVSYGGSSVVAIALGIGMLLAITRTRSRAERGWEAAP
jgi:cell division protein FtsW